MALMAIASWALMGRILLLGFERILVKRLGTGAAPSAGAFLFFAIGAIFIIPPAVLERHDGDLGWLLPLCLASAIYAAAFVLYVRSLAVGDASLVSPLYNANVVFLAIIAFLFLGEPMTLLKLLGLILLVWGAARLNPRGSVLRSLMALGQDDASRWMVAASLLIAIGRVIDKATLAYAPPARYAAVLYAAIAGWLLLWLYLRGATAAPLALFRRNPTLAMTCGAVNGLSYLCLVRALTVYDVAVAEPASMLGLLVTLALSWILLREPVAARLPGAILMLTGAWIVLAA